MLRWLKHPAPPLLQISSSPPLSTTVRKTFAMKRCAGDSIELFYKRLASRGKANVSKH
jgi:hypothetical protein